MSSCVSVEHLKPGGSPACGAEALVVEANGGFGERARHVGLRWLQRFVRETRPSLPTLIYSFESREQLGVKFPMLTTGWRGVGFLRLPFTGAELKRSLDALEPLSEGQLDEYLRWYCDLQSEWREAAHDLSAARKDWPAGRARAERILGGWASSVLSYAPDQRPALENLQRVFGGDNDEVRAAIRQLEDGLCSKTVRRAAPEGPGALPYAPRRRAPAGFSTVVIADDEGYERATIESLKRHGYTVKEPAKTLEEAENLVRFWRPRIVLADLNFPSREESKRLIEFALAAGCLVIAVSRAAALPGELPDGVEDCCGGGDFQDAERIHRLICRYALAEGAK